MSEHDDPVWLAAGAEGHVITDMLPPVRHPAERRVRPGMILGVESWRRLAIHVRPGVYREKLTVGGTKGPLTLQGLSVRKTAELCDLPCVCPGSLPKSP